jgi:deazaflavin-dependent oxidoreductase (nitroreductase family)
MDNVKDKPQRLNMKDWPVLVDQLGLGWLLGRQFLVIAHHGRRSGLLRRTGVMVLNEDPISGEICAAAGSLKSDWYRNILAEPALLISHAGHRFVPVQRMLTCEELAAHISQARKNHPFQAWVQSRFFHWRWTTSPKEIATLASTLGGVSFRPN